MKNKKIKQFMKVLSVFAVITVILVCTTLPAFARSSFGSVTYKGKPYYNLATAESISYYFADKDAYVSNVSIPNTRTITGNTKGKPSFAHIQLGSTSSDAIALAPGNTIQFHIRYWFTVRLENDPDTYVFNYAGSDVEIGYALHDSPLKHRVTAKADVSYSASATLPYVADFSFTNTADSTIYIYTIEVGDIDGDNTWPAGEKRNTLSGYFNINQIYYRVVTASEASTDTLVNGWTPKPQKPSGSGTVESTNDLEHQISQNAQAGIDQSNSLFGSFGDTMSILTSGMIFVTGLFNTMLGKMQFLESLAIIGLVLGIIGFILNLVPSIGSRLSRSDRDRERKEKERVRAEKQREKRVERKNYNNIGNRTRRR